MSVEAIKELYESMCKSEDSDLHCRKLLEYIQKQESSVEGGAPDSLKSVEEVQQYLASLNAPDYVLLDKFNSIQEKLPYLLLDPARRNSLFNLEYGYADLHTFMRMNPDVVAASASPDVMANIILDRLERTKPNYQLMMMKGIIEYYLKMDAQDIRKRTIYNFIRDTLQKAAQYNPYKRNIMISDENDPFKQAIKHDYDLIFYEYAKMTHNKKLLKRLELRGPVLERIMQKNDL